MCIKFLLKILAQLSKCFNLSGNMEKYQRFQRLLEFCYITVFQCKKDGKNGVYRDGVSGYSMRLQKSVPDLPVSHDCSRFAKPENRNVIGLR